MVTIRPAKAEDFDFFFRIKSEDSNIFWSGHDSPPDRENLLAFYTDALKNAGREDTRKIYIVENIGSAVGYLYFIPDTEGRFDLAAAISASCQGHGYGKEAIRLGLEEGKRMGFRKMAGSIREDNEASLKAYAANGVKILQEFRLVYIPKLEKDVKMFFVEKDL